MKKLLVISMLFAGLSAFAQNSDVMLTQQWFSRINRNPAATGNSEDFDFFLLARHQWSGFDDSPKTVLFNAHSYYDKIRSGLGLSFYYDNTGVADQQMVGKITYSYQIDLNEKTVLSFGLGAGVFYKSIDYSKHEWDDEVEYSDMEKKVSPDVDFGIELSHEKVLVGASITHLGRPRNKLTDLKPVQHHYLYARGNFRLSPSFDIAPHVTYQNSGEINQLSLGATLFFKKRFWLGIDYRTPSPKDIFSDYDYSTLTAFIGAEFNKFRVGYSYDLALGRLSKISRSTHELMLSLRIPRKKAPEQRFIP